MKRSLCRELLNPLSQEIAEGPSVQLGWFLYLRVTLAFREVISSWAHISMGLDPNLFPASSHEC